MSNFITIFHYGVYKDRWAASWQNQQNCMCDQRRLRSASASAQSDQSLHCLHEESLGSELPIEHTAKTLIRLGRCPGWSESLLGVHAILLILSRCGSNFSQKFHFPTSDCKIKALLLPQPRKLYFDIMVALSLSDTDCCDIFTSTIVEDFTFCLNVWSFLWFWYALSILNVFLCIKCLFNGVVYLDVCFIFSLVSNEIFCRSKIVWVPIFV